MFLLLVTYACTAVADYGVFFLLLAITKHQWPGGKAAYLLLLYGPFVSMLLPGTRQFVRQHWVSGMVLVIVGALLAWSITLLVAAVAWITF